ncbi:MAG: phosphoglycerate dehydrogenase [Planctomycetes bacterium RBG_16_64_12]|nr:MAG: phosphoglycerate dehydrogenase [Planctomycetes bacterium RBG_16_64_12]
MSHSRFGASGASFRRSAVMRIVLCYPVEPRHCERIAEVARDAEIVDAGQERIAPAIFSADIYCGHAKVPVDWDGVVRAGRLRWIQSSAAGMDHCLVPSVIESEIIVTSASGVLADQVAEHTIALVTGWCRGLPVFFRAQEKKEFIRRPTRDLTHSTVGIVGLGGVGRRLAQLLRVFKTRILATDVFPVDKPEYVDALWPADRLNDLLAESDFVVLSLPLNETTRAMIDAEALARMKPGAMLVNVARGPLVVEADLVAALLSRRLAGAVLDVTDPEPLPPESKLWEMPNVIITPHVAGQSARRIDNMTDLFCENLDRWQTGRPLINYLADKRLGFPTRGSGTLIWGDQA